VRDTTGDFEAYTYTRALERTESLFWFFCDNYLELVKSRRYGDHGEAGAGSAVSAMLVALDVLLRLFAPFLPFATEEVWSWWREGSIHRAAWPVADDIARFREDDEDGVLALEIAALVLGEVRKCKSEAKRPLKTPVRRVVVKGPAASLATLALVEPDLRAAGTIERVETVPDDTLSVEVELAGDEADA
jgi:valyl-tRNA synthetase